MKNRTSKQSKACDISKRVRDEVLDRDKYCCCVCGSPYNLTMAHVFLNRSHQGLGVKENLATLCMKCHHSLDNGKNAEHNGIKRVLHDYMNRLYPNLNIEELRYKNKWE